MAGRGNDGVGDIFISFAIRHGKCHCGMYHVFVWKIRSWEIMEIFTIGIYDRIASEVSRLNIWTIRRTISKNMVRKIAMQC